MRPGSGTAEAAMKLSKVIQSLLLSLLALSGIGYAMPPDPTILNEADESMMEEATTNEKRAALSTVSVPLTLGEWEALAILIEFPNESMIKTNKDFQELLFGSISTGSVREYYEEASYGKFHLTGETVGIYGAGNSASYYANDKYGFGGYPKNAARLIEEAVDATIASGVDCSRYDNNGDGEVDAIFIVHAGQGAEQSGKSSHLWSHRGRISSSGGKVRNCGGVRVDSYIIGPELSGSSSIATIGVLAHEFGHILGLPDLYDLDQTSLGVGRWDIMSYGAWNNGGKTPAHFSAWSKAKLGWFEPTLITEDRLGESIAPLYAEPAVYKIWANGVPSDEYFLIENRQKVGFDTYLPGSGLIALHVDEAQSNNNNECISLGCDQRFLVSLVQADGRYDLELKKNYGDASDPFTNGGVPLVAYNGVRSPVEIANISMGTEMIVADLRMSTAPLILSVPPSEAAPNQTYEYTPTTVSSGSSVSWNLAKGPSGMSVNEATGGVSWAPDDSQMGDHLIQLEGTSAEGESTTQEWLLTVTYGGMAPTTNDDSAGGCSTAGVSLTAGSHPSNSALLSWIMIFLPGFAILILRRLRLLRAYVKAALRVKR
ncbi:MAG: M6 family metalloprotease domain-containing protein [Deltaproteobacteria bacterium]|nr:M6 family metalloprotease domain-containing protein [Deltaproteobacteria bacterium]